jgi:hypothetical protein
MYQYRITKYDPQFRDASGAYKLDDWTSISDIGRTFNNIELTAECYVTVENSYVEAALAFLTEAGVTSLAIKSLENHRRHNCPAVSLTEGHSCTLLEIADIIRLNLREIIWCKLVGDGCFLHFGYDYYMYVGVPAICTASIEFAERRRLFVEPSESPYLAERT